MDCWEALRRWDSWMDVAGMADKTRRSYTYRILRMSADLMRDPLELDEDDIIGYLSELPPRGHSRGDVTRACRSFYGWAEERGLVRSPVKRITSKRVKYGPAPSMTQEEITQLAIAAANRDPRRGWTVLLLYATGARVGSFVKVRPEDVHLDGEHSWITFMEAKGRQPYRVPLGPMGQEAARELLALRDPDLPTLIGVGRAAVEAWVRQAGEDCGLHSWPHLLRHSRARSSRRRSVVGICLQFLRGPAPQADLTLRLGPEVGDPPVRSGEHAEEFSGRRVAYG